ncbi:unnamed protein product, partial [Amoebophrya sp. A25]|eukprot:GSA25T00024580001.1
MPTSKLKLHADESFFNLGSQSNASAAASLTPSVTDSKPAAKKKMGRPPKTLLSQLKANTDSELLTSKNWSELGIELTGNEQDKAGSSSSSSSSSSTSSRGSKLFAPTSTSASSSVGFVDGNGDVKTKWSELAEVQKALSRLDNRFYHADIDDKEAQAEALNEASQLLTEAQDRVCSTSGAELCGQAAKDVKNFTKALSSNSATTTTTTSSTSSVQPQNDVPPNATCNSSISSITAVHKKKIGRPRKSATQLVAAPAQTKAAAKKAAKIAARKKKVVQAEDDEIEHVDECADDKELEPAPKKRRGRPPKEAPIAAPARAGDGGKGVKRKTKRHLELEEADATSEESSEEEDWDEKKNASKYDDSDDDARVTIEKYRTCMNPMDALHID